MSIECQMAAVSHLVLDIFQTVHYSYYLNDEIASGKGSDTYLNGPLVSTIHEFPSWLFVCVCEMVNNKNIHSVLCNGMVSMCHSLWI